MRAGRQHGVDRFGRGRGQGGQVPHLAARPRGSPCHTGAASRCGNRQAAAQSGTPVCHKSPSRLAIAAGRNSSVEPSGKSADGPQLLLELAGHASVEREVARVVRPRRQLVDQQRAVAGDEELDAQHADHVERFEHAARDLDRLARELAARRAAGATETSRMWLACVLAITP